MACRTDDRIGWVGTLCPTAAKDPVAALGSYGELSMYIRGKGAESVMMLAPEYRWTVSVLEAETVAGRSGGICASGSAWASPQLSPSRSSAPVAARPPRALRARTRTNPPWAPCPAYAPVRRYFRHQLALRRPPDARPVRWNSQTGPCGHGGVRVREFRRNDSNVPLHAYACRIALIRSGDSRSRLCQ